MTEIIKLKMIFSVFWTNIGKEKKNIETKMKNSPKYRGQKSIFTFLLFFFPFCVFLVNSNDKGNIGSKKQLAYI